MPELITVLQEFERTNKVEIKLFGELVTHAGRQDLEWRLEAWGEFMGEPAAKLLASVKRTCMGSRLVTMEALLLQLLYSMDFELGLLEFQRTDETV